MNRMMSEVLRWEKSAGAPRFPHRWTDWARALTERYVWISMGRPRSSLTLIQPRAPIHRFYQRWEQYARTFSPRLNLAVNLIQGQTLRYMMPTLPAVRLAGPYSPQLGPVRERMTMHHWVGNRWRAGGAPVAKLREPSRRTPVAREKTTTVVPSPLRRVLRRTGFEEVDETVTVSRINRLSRVAELSSKILRRLLETGQRVETQPTRTLVIRQPQNLAPGGAVVETGPTTRQSPWGSRVGGPGMAQGSPPAAIDLELLTEKVVRQIEQRIVAYRERMGKLF